ncbi:elicitor-associated permease-like protein [Priestia taiwanensis]|uniref:Uncharacterized protein n=1 Tax=Priestia taiwanensis TaxID=1347902 RepID=A0A917ESD4_9BACI|nr:elicitor-associated permease-like protein [Priestia taiwanensis]MBM7365066.1 hypothetical protein [Priestia taiwanensis]GGE83804.1 hypothetical protein GCM10007140_36650 [Priestia taiwanensis]
MNFINYLSFKYKLNRHKPKGSLRDLFLEVFVISFLFMVLTLILFLIIKLFPQYIQDDMNKYILGLYAFVCLISLSSSIKKFYKEYFLSPEREILLVAPIKNSQIILSRFFIVAIEIITINMMFLLPFILANYFANNIPIEIFLITIPQIVASSIFFSVIAHILFALAYIISKGRGLKTIAYSLVTFSSVGVVAIIVYLQNYSSFLLTQNKFVENIFYLLFQYPNYLLLNKIDLLNAGLFTLFVLINALCFIPIAYWMTNYCYNKGLLSISSRDLDRSFYLNKVSNVIHKCIGSHFIKKDLLYLLRSPKLFSVFVSPFLLTSVLEYKNQFASSGSLLTVLINIFTLVITSVILHILMSDDLNHQELLFSAPFDIEELYNKRVNFLHLSSFIISGTYLLTVCILESVRIEVIIYGMGQLLFITYISSRVLLSRTFKRCTKDGRGYMYDGKIIRTIVYYFFVWSVPLMIFFATLQESLVMLLDNGTFSTLGKFGNIAILVVILAMLYKGSKSNIEHKESRS